MNRTKNTIIDTFWLLLEEKPYNKITVKDIVDRCQMNRNTFYYHFHDIPELLETAVKNDGNPDTDLRAILMKFRQFLLHFLKQVFFASLCASYLRECVQTFSLNDEEMFYVQDCSHSCSRRGHSPVLFQVFQRFHPT